MPHIKSDEMALLKPVHSYTYFRAETMFNKLSPAWLNNFYPAGIVQVGSQTLKGVTWIPFIIMAASLVNKESRLEF